MKVLFLDVDEVLVTRRQWFVYKSVFINTKNVGRKVDQTTLDFLRMLNFHGVEIVLSSTWRKSSNEKFENLKKEFKLDIKDRTGILGGLRGEEIADWLSQHKDVTHYVIVDDSRDMLPSQMPHFVNIDPIAGVTVDDMENICKILGFEEPWDLRDSWNEAINSGKIENPWV